MGELEHNEVIHMYIPLLILLSVTAGSGLSLSYKLGAKRTVDPVSSPPLMCGMASVLVCVVYSALAFFMDGGIAFPQKQSLWYALMAGCAYTTAALGYLLALSCGPYSVTLIILNISSFMPILYSHLILDEPVSVWQLVGLAVLLGACVTLTVLRSRGNKGGKFNIRWMLFALMTFVANGFINFAIRLNTRLTPDTSRNSLFAVAYALAAVLCFVFFFLSGGVRKKLRPGPLMAPAAGVAASLTMQLTPNSILPLYLTAALQYPLVNGMTILAGVAIGVIFFKEKIGLGGWLCIGAIIGALCMLGIG